jgi:hypothetical protein
MAEIAVRREGDDTFEVRVREGAGASTHAVILDDEVYGRLGAGYASKEEFLRVCFEFLLAREPKESILSRFEVPVIARYFPEFEDEIRR